MYIYNYVAKNQNIIIKETNDEFGEDTPYKKLLNFPETQVIIGSTFTGLFILFIVSRIMLCGNSYNEFKDKPIDFDKGYIEFNHDSYIILVDGHLKEYKLTNTKVLITDKVSSPVIKDYYKRHVKKAIKNHNLYFLYNRKVDTYSEWEVVKNSSCGCSDKKLIIMTEKQYEMKRINYR